MPLTRILLLEDNRLSGDGAAAILSEQRGFKAAWHSGRAGDLLDKIKLFKPHIIVLRIPRNLEDNLKVVSFLRGEYPHIAIIAMGLDQARTDILKYMTAGVSGFIAHNASLTSVFNTIRAVAQGKKVFPAQMAGQQFAQIVQAALKAEDDALLDSKSRISGREQEIIDQVAIGRTNRQIASELNIAVHTVKSHIHHILGKLALESRLQIAIHASGGKIHKPDHLNGPDGQSHSDGLP